MKGEVLYLYAYDVAYELPLAAIARSVDRAGEEALRPGTSAPRGVRFERCVHVGLEPIRAGETFLDVSANVYAFGAVSITLRLEARGDTLLDFLRWHAPVLPGHASLDAVARGALEGLLAKMAEHVEEGSFAPEEPEAYTVFRLAPEDLGLEDAEAWLGARGREAAALLTGEPDPSRLSDAEVAETLGQRFSYYRDDLVVVDWDAALLVEKAGGAADVLRVIELANLQLVEYRHYDAVLDRVVDRAYDDLERVHGGVVPLFGVGEPVRKLRELRVSLSEVAEQVSNATKFFGDWHLARLYMGCARRFHLPEWKASVEEKLRTLDELYHLAASESSNRKMLALETIIVLLFVVDLVLLAILPFR
ncbi:MAG TPA: hypothetical protein VFI25_06350 [Planctomycetota bacterium]|nr:hypothetical protein [Planctomycetota bacterium]